MSNTQPHAVVIGAGIAGMASTIALTRIGYRVTLIERDNSARPENLADAASWERKGAPQFHHPHVFLPGLRKILRESYPDLLDLILDSGVSESLFLALGPASKLAEEQELFMLPCRRAVFEWLVRDLLQKEPGVDLRLGIAVGGLLGTAQVDGKPAVVTGVRLAGGDEILADLVVAADGRRSGLPDWLKTLGVEIGEEVKQAPSLYMTRFYRFIGDDLGLKLIAGREGGLTAGAVRADNDTFAISLVPDPADVEMRRHLQDPDRFHAVARAMPAVSRFVADGISESITGVHGMGGLINRRRDYHDTAGEPLALGVFAVGDTYVCTNPVYGRGCTLAFLQSTLLANALQENPDDLAAAARAYEDDNRVQVRPWYDVSVLTDALVFSGPDGPDGPGTGTGSSLMPDGADPELIVAFMRFMSMMDPPAVAMMNPKIQEALQLIGGGPAGLTKKQTEEAPEEPLSTARTSTESSKPSSIPQLTREDLLALQP